MTKANEWEAFFDGHAPYYREEPFTRNTAVEIEFLIAELNLADGACMLDSSGLQVEYLWGGTAGSWLRQPPGLDEMELMAIARKPG